MKITLRSMYDSFPPTYGDSDKQINFYVDNNVYFLEDKDDPDAICLLVEPRAIIPMTYKWVEEHFSKFRYVFTFDSQMLKYPNAKLLIYGQITAEYPNMPKTKEISMVCSDKAFCDGHRSRQYVARELSAYIDTYGKFNGGQFADDKTIYDGYRFNVAMENYQDGHYFTEKICNCFASKVIPIYYGCPNIGEYFNTDGIIICDSPDDVIEKTLSIIDPVKEYEKRLDAMFDNFHRVQKYRSYAKLFLEMYVDLLEEG